MNISAIQCELLSESCLILRIAEDISEEYLESLENICSAAEIFFSNTLIELIPSYNSLYIEFDCQKFEPQRALLEFKQFLKQFDAGDERQYSALSSEHTANIDIPIYYHPEVGWDLAALSQQLNRPWQEIVDIHQSQTYRVYAMGFAPGFAFMGLLNESLRVNRRATPRSQVPKGSLAIAELQTAIYPQKSPGGWHIIGRCPIDLFDSTQEPANKLKVHQQVTFTSISREKYLSLGGEIQSSS